jgi:ABC-type multidrug transport system fused ATPase/permease subunit
MHYAMQNDEPHRPPNRAAFVGLLLSLVLSLLLWWGLFRLGVWLWSLSAAQLVDLGVLLAGSVAVFLGLCEAERVARSRRRRARERRAA